MDVQVIQEPLERDIVLQCSSCKAIIGDTQDYRMVYSNGDHTFIVLSGARNC